MSKRSRLLNIEDICK